MLDCCNFEMTVGSGNRLTNEQKMLFEIFQLIHKIDSYMKDTWSLYTYTDTLLELEKAKDILRGGKSFDMIAYSLYFNEDLSGPQQHTKVYSGTFLHIINSRVSSKVCFEGFKKMTFRLEENGKVAADTFIGVSSDPYGENMIRKISQHDINSDSTSAVIYSNQCYVHYPYIPSRVMGYGNGNSYQLGNKKTEDSSLLEEFFDFDKPVKSIKSVNTVTIALDNDGKLYFCGYKPSFGNTNETMKEYTQKIPDSKIVDFDSSRSNLIVLTEEGKLYMEGNQGSFNMESDYGDKNELWYKARPDEDTEQVVSFKAGTHFHAYVTDNGKLYAAGNAILDHLNIPNHTKDYTRVELPENVLVKDLRINGANSLSQFIIIFVEVDGKPQIWSAGNDESYNRLGQGEEVKISHTFQCLDYDKDTITFKDVQIGERHCLAITTNGELYGWGRNTDKQLGMSDTDKVISSPTKLPYFEDYIVHEIQCASSFSVLKAAHKDNLDKIMLFNLGKVLGCNSDGKTEEGVFHFKKFDDSEIKMFRANDENTILVYEGQEKRSKTDGVHHGYTCEVTEQSPIQGILHFYKDNESKWHFLSREGYEQSKNKLPSVCYFTKSYIEDIQGKEWPEISSKDIMEESNDVFDPTHLINVSISEGNFKPIVKTSPRTAPLAEDQKEADLIGFRVEADPDYSFQKNDVMISLEYDQYMRMQDRIKLFDEKLDDELNTQIENNMKMMGQNFIECPYVFIMAADIQFNDPTLRAMPTENVDARIKSIVMFNQYLLKSLPFLCFDREIIEEEKDGKIVLQNESLTASFILGKKYALESIKTEYIKIISDGISNLDAQDSIDIELNSIRKKFKRREIDNKAEFSVFGKCYQILKNSNFRVMRTKHYTNSCWNARLMPNCEQNTRTFKQSVSLIIRELHSIHLPLFIQSNNNKSETGSHQDKWVLNPSWNSQNQLEMYKFVGALMALAFRSGQAMDFKLAPFFWKKFQCEPLELEDLESFDERLFLQLQDIKKNQFDNDEITMFVTSLSNGQKVILKEKGDEIPVTEDNFEEYISLVLKARFSECEQQVLYIQKGFDYVFPSEIVRTLAWEDFEARVTGRPITVEHLKKITSYQNMAEDDETGKNFWKMLSSFTPTELNNFLVHYYGPERLPHESKESELSISVTLKNAGDYYGDEYQICIEHDGTSVEDMKKNTLEHMQKSQKYFPKLILRSSQCPADGEISDVMSQSSRGPPSRQSTIEGSAPNSPQPVERRNANDSDDDSDSEESSDSIEDESSTSSDCLSGSDDSSF